MDDKIYYYNPYMFYFHLPDLFSMGLFGKLNKYSIIKIIISLLLSTVAFTIQFREIKVF